MYCVGVYVKDGEIEREYTPAEFDSLSDGTRKEMGLRPFSLSKLLGHADVKMTQVYAKIINKKKDEAVNLVNGLFH